MADKAMSTMATDDSIAGTERLLAQGADGSIIVVDTLVAYAIDELVGAAAITPTTGDAFVVERSGTEGTFDLDATADYIIAYAFDNASEGDPALTGDMLLAERSHVSKRMDIDTVVTYVLATSSAAATNLQAGVLNFSGLSTATLTASDIVAVCQTTTGKKTTLTALTTYFDAALIALGTMQTSACAYLLTYATALSAKTIGAAADTFYVISSGVAYKMTLATIAEYCADATYDLPWQLISEASYTALPTSTSTLAMSDTTGISIGDPVKFTWSGTTYYAIVTAMSGNASITIAGAPFSTSVSLTNLYVGTPGQVKSITYWVSDLFGDTTYDLLSTVGRYERWDGAPAYLVAFAATAGEADTGAEQPKINVKIAGSAVSTYDTNKGLQVSSSAGTWIASSAVDIDTSNYSIARGDAIEFACTEAGTNGDAADLTITLTFVYE